jgi:hypothetical protein
VKPCSRCEQKAARGKPHHWRPDLCGDCVEEIKHPTQRGTEFTVDRERRDAANLMLAELSKQSAYRCRHCGAAARQPHWDYCGQCQRDENKDESSDSISNVRR